jgi:hypothetical protein
MHIEKLSNSLEQSVKHDCSPQFGITTVPAKTLNFCYDRAESTKVGKKTDFGRTELKPKNVKVKYWVS